MCNNPLQAAARYDCVLLLVCLESCGGVLGGKFFVARNVLAALMSVPTAATGASTRGGTYDTQQYIDTPDGLST